MLLLNLTLPVVYCHIFPLSLKESLVAERHTITLSRPKPQYLGKFNVLCAETYNNIY